MVAIYLRELQNQVKFDNYEAKKFCYNDPLLVPVTVSVIVYE